MVTFQAAHRPHPGLQPPVVSLDGIIRVLLEGVQRRGDQLVEDPLVKVLYNRRGVSDYALYDEAGILERTGVTPKQYPEYAALRGDPSDGLPGLRGVGAVTAAGMVRRHGDIAGVLRDRSSEAILLFIGDANPQTAPSKSHEPRNCPEVDP